MVCIVVLKYVDLLITVITNEMNEIFDSISYNKICTLNPCQKSLQPINVPLHNPDEINEIFGSISYDSCQKSSHPIHVPVHNPDEINEIFGSISYDKICTLNPCQKSSHPIHVPVHNPDEINEIFDLSPMTPVRKVHILYMYLFIILMKSMRYLILSPIIRYVL